MQANWEGYQYAAIRLNYSHWGHNRKLNRQINALVVLFPGMGDGMIVTILKKLLQISFGTLIATERIIDDFAAIKSLQNRSGKGGSNAY
ncbi:MAG: hypothetical protein KDB03_25280 [Planctomycetales bacterium]|nr:hypothetical protein [Planctomycetales bacterium]